MTNESEIKELIEKARQSLEASKLLFDQGFIDFSASRAYYSMFYAVEALLLSRNLSYSKNSAVISAFWKTFVKTGILDAKYHRYILDAFHLRNKDECGAMNVVPKEKAEEIISNTFDLLNVIQSKLFTGQAMDYVLSKNSELYRRLA
ncbi:MAG: HEPN domain-containing protein [Candidatus Omnitrophota bacterium]